MSPNKTFPTYREQRSNSYMRSIFTNTRPPPLLPPLFVSPSLGLSHPTTWPTYVGHLVLFEVKRKG